MSIFFTAFYLASISTYSHYAEYRMKESWELHANFYPAIFCRIQAYPLLSASPSTCLFHSFVFRLPNQPPPPPSVLQEIDQLKANKSNFIYKSLCQNEEEWLCQILVRKSFTNIDLMKNSGRHVSRSVFTLLFSNHQNRHRLYGLPDLVPFQMLILLYNWGLCEKKIKYAFNKHFR